MGIALLYERFHGFALDLKLAGYSEQTIRSYLYYNGMFLDFISKQQRFVSGSDIKRYLLSLYQRGCKERTLNLALSALKAYYQDYMKKKLFTDIKRARLPDDQPHVLTKEEIISMIDSEENEKHRLLIQLLYSSGLRIGECVRIKMSEIDIKERTIFIRRGKGKKDRLVTASTRFCDDMVSYLKNRKRVSEYIFESEAGHISIRCAQEIIKRSAKKAGIRKRVYPHLLRATYTTPLIDHDASIDKGNRLMGHKDINTTRGYIRTSIENLRTVKSPLDCL